MAYAGDYTGDPGATYPDQDPSNPPPGYRWDARTGTFVPIDQPAAPAPAGNPLPPDVITPPSPPPPSPPPPGGTLGQPFAGGFTAPTPTPLPGVPEYTAPGYTPPPAFSYADFTPPDAQTVLNRPGYDFRRKQGEQTILNDRAHSGLLNTGSTLKDIIGYGQDYATNEYGNEWNRSAAEYGLNRANAADTYRTNYGSQFIDPYNISRQNALDTFSPKMVGYTTNAAATQRQNELDWTHAFDLTNFDWQKYKDFRDSTWDKNYQYATS